MKKFAIIEDNKVVNMIIAEPAFIAKMGWQAIEVLDSRITMGTEVVDGVPVLEESNVITKVKTHLPAAKAKKLVSKLEAILYRNEQVALTEKEQETIKMAGVPVIASEE